MVICSLSVVKNYREEERRQPAVSEGYVQRKVERFRWVFPNHTDQKLTVLFYLADLSNVNT